MQQVGAALRRRVESLESARHEQVMREREALVIQAFRLLTDAEILEFLASCQDEREGQDGARVAAFDLAMTRAQAHLLAAGGDIDEAFRQASARRCEPVTQEPVRAATPEDEWANKTAWVADGQGRA